MRLHEILYIVGGVTVLSGYDVYSCLDGWPGGYGVGRGK